MPAGAVCDKPVPTYVLRPKGTCVDVVVASEVVALEIALSSARVSDFAHCTSATRLGNQTCLRASCSKRSLPTARFHP